MPEEKKKKYNYHYAVVALSKETRERLAKLKRYRRETYDEIVKRLLENVEAK